MRHTLAFLVVALSIGAGVIVYIGFDSSVARSESADTPLRVQPPQPSVASWALFDVETGAILDGDNVETVLPIASITKLFTAHAVMSTGSRDETTIINWNDLDTEGRAGKLAHGEHITLGELLFPLLLESSNDAGAAIDRALGERGREATRALISQLGLSHTRIADATGLSAANVSSAVDLARFFSYLVREEPSVLGITKLRMYISEDERGYVNNDPARELSGFLGGKHGYTSEAGRTFVGSFSLARGGEVGIALLGSTDIRADLEDILVYAEAR